MNTNTNNTTTNTANINGVAITDLAAIFEKYNGMTANDALRVATLNIELERALANGTATFEYVKKDGTRRVATGTNKNTITTNFYTFKGSTANKPNTVIRYYDLERGAFRSLRRENLVRIVAAA